MRNAFFVALALWLATASVAQARELTADPTTLASVLPTLMPGDTLRLASGTYAGRIRVTNLNGTADQPIVIEGPADGSAVIQADPGGCCNMLELRDSSYVVIRSITFDGGHVDNVFGISAGITGSGGSGSRNVVHHITVEDSRFINFDQSVNHDAISTKTTTWGWVLRRNVFDGAGVGAYFGNSTGNHPFIGGLIEHNLFVNCGGYCMEVKWQSSRIADWPGIPTEPQVTIIRHNVFHHGDSTRFAARPNLLVGGFPSTGLGSEDYYEIYGNLFIHNGREALLQASGRVSIHDNVFVDGDDSVPALVLRNHDLPLRRAWVYGNTFYTSGRAISVGSGDQGTALVGNAIYAGTAMSGTFDVSRDNVIGDLDAAAGSFMSATLALASMDFHPKSPLMGSAISLAEFASDVGVGYDFECRPRSRPQWRGAYEGRADERSWTLALEIKPDLCATGAPGEPDGGVGDEDGGVAFPDDDASVPLDDDGGVVATDAGVRGDGGTGGGGDTGGGEPPGASSDGGCSCRIAPRAASPGAVAVLIAIGLALAIRRRHRA